MATKISWTNETWNPVAGCNMMSAGCKNCYAMRMAARLDAMGQDKYQGLVHRVGDRPVWTGLVKTVESELEKPYRWRKPRMVFVNSMSDLFHKKVPFSFVDQVIDVITDNSQHTFQILTKRAGRLAQYAKNHKKWPENLWVGISAENDKYAQIRIPQLLSVPAAIHFVSYEPALGNINWASEWGQDLDWVIYGAESGAKRRPHNMQWARNARDFCTQHDIAFFYKQGSATRSGVAPYLVENDGSQWYWQQYPYDLAEPMKLAS